MKYGQHVFHFRFPRQIVLSDECIFHSSEFLNTQNICIWGPEIQNGIQKHEFHCKKVSVRCAVHTNSMVSQYYFDNEAVRGVDYYQLLDTYVRSDGH